MEQKISQLKRKYILCIIIIFLFSIGTGFALGHNTNLVRFVSPKGIRENTDKYTFIHPLLATGIGDATNPSPDYIPLYKKVKSFISAQEGRSDVQNISVYFINYGKSGFFSFNEDERYAPASLLKVVIMVGYLKKSDENSKILDQKFTYAPDIAESIEAVPFQTPTKLKVGFSYSVSSLIDDMIIDSDNGAMNLLLAHIDDEYLTEVYKDLGLEFPKENSLYTISTKEYSLFFRILFNATYLSKKNSEKALSILSKATFNGGLSHELPAGVVVAHKFGEHVNGEGDRIDSIELHDCGIIYDNAGGPYLLCVMTRGKALASLKETIGSISKIVYDDISSH
jgi:hypothetical protein